MEERIQEETNDRGSGYISQEETKETYDFINPDHYRMQEKEVWEMMVDIWGVEKFITYCEINAFKYRMRAGLKPDQPVQQDIDKALWYENKAKELRDMSETNTFTNPPNQTIYSPYYQDEDQFRLTCTCTASCFGANACICNLNEINSNAKEEF